MLKKIPLYLVLICLLSMFVSAGELVKVVSIDLTDITKLEKIESLDLKVLGLDETQLFTVVGENEIEELREAKVHFNFLSEFLQSDEIYLFSYKEKQQFSYPKGGLSNQVKIGNKIVAQSNTPENIEDERYKKIKLDDINRTFKNIKSRFNAIQSNVLDSLISSITEDVDSASVKNYIQGLQDFETRFLRHPNRKEVALWIKTQFELMGYTDVVLDSFMVGGYRQYNVIATYPAAAPSDQYIVIGGHHDSITNQSLNDVDAPAPGADDNASGTTAVLESARVIIENNFQSEVNIKFVTFAAEELGLYGGFDYARKAANSGMQIKLMINHDMISNNNSSLSSSIVDINYYTGSEAFSQLAYQSVDKFTEINVEYGSANSSGSDSYAFWQNDYNAVYFEESNFSSYYHTSEDKVSHYDMAFCAEVIKASVGTVISTSIAPAMVNNYYITDVGDGTSLLVNWDASSENDLVGYLVYVGTSEGNYTMSYETTNTSYTLTGLNEGEIYYIGVAAKDGDGYESFIVERTKIPYSVPQTPTEFTVEPVWQSVNLNWSPNEELDLAGYNVYRSGIDTDEIIKLNKDVITETQFTDNTIESGIFYEYQVKAVDDDQNESTNTDYLISRGVTLDQGILLVDETEDGDGSIFSPTDEEVDQFYESMLENFAYTNFDLKTVGKINLADLGAYDVIIWYGDDKTDQNAIAYQDDIRKYLEFGGKLLYSGYRPSKTFEGVTSLSKTFDDGDFLYDFFKVEEVNYSLLAKFDGAIAISNDYADLNLDQTKLNSNGDNHINGIETFVVTENANAIYSYHTSYDVGTPQVLLSGGTVGFEYIGNDYSTIVLSFPLYYVNDLSAETFVDYVLSQKFGLTTDVKSIEEDVPTKFTLMQNYPNPFNPTTRIKFSILHSQFTTLKVYDILGREVKTLVNEVKQPGSYEVEFNASDLASGIYFYSINAGEFTATKKLMLIK